MRLRYVGDPDRHYPSLALVPVPGDVYELPDDPADGRWQEVSAPKPRTSKESATAKGGE